MKPPWLTAVIIGAVWTASCSPRPSEGAPDDPGLAHMLVGVWRMPDQYCDSGDPIRYNANGTIIGLGIEGRWQIEGDVLTQEARILNQIDDETAGWTGSRTSSRLRPIGRDWLIVTPDDGGDPYEIVRCPSSDDAQDP